MTVPVNQWFTPPARADIHTLDQRCHLCASDTELETLPVPADTSPGQCPFWTNADEVAR